MVEVEQYELDFDRENAKLGVRSEIEAVLAALEGALTPEHFSSLIEKASERGMARPLTEEEVATVRGYALEHNTPQKLDADEVIALLFPEQREAA